jgi:hypothetical protein
VAGRGSEERLSMGAADTNCTSAAGMDRMRRLSNLMTRVLGDDGGVYVGQNLMSERRWEGGEVGRVLSRTAMEGRLRTIGKMEVYEKMEVREGEEPGMMVKSVG